jgi:hypothetical protein
VPKRRELGVGLLKKLMAKASISNEEYLELFYR